VDGRPARHFQIKARERPELSPAACAAEERRKTMRKSIMLLALSGALVVAAGIPFATPAVGESPNLNPKILPIDSKPYGKSYGEWAGAWWRWACSIPADRNPLLDQTGEDAAVGQSGPVWFLAGTTGGAAERTVTVPAGKALFFPIVNLIWVNGPGDDPWSDEQEAFVRGLLTWFIDTATGLACEIDGIPVANLEGYRCQTPPGMEYMVTFPANNYWDWDPGTYGPSLDEGYYLMVAPLPVGEHTISFEGGIPDFGLSIEVTYHLTVMK
jgi:hypothetical protein